MSNGYKKYMKQDVKEENEYNFVKIFIISFCAMLLIFTFLIKSFSPSVDTSVGDYKTDNELSEKTSVDQSLSSIQAEDNDNYSLNLFKNSEGNQENTTTQQDVVKQDIKEEPQQSNVQSAVPAPVAEPVYKVFIGAYTTSEQARVAKDIIQETGSNLNPIVKCLGSNNYTLQVGIFKNKNSAEALLYSIQQNHLPGRIVQE